MNFTRAVIAVHDNQAVQNATWELLAMAKKLPQTDTQNTCVIFIGSDITALANDFSSKSGYPAMAVNSPEADQYNIRQTHALLTRALGSQELEYVIAMHNAFGMDFSPGLSVKLGGSCITSVEDIQQEDGRIVLVRSMFGGKIQARHLPGKMPQVLTVLPGANKAEPTDCKAQANVSEITIDAQTDGITYTGRLPSPASGEGLSKAEVVISGGRGIEDEENYELIEKLAELFSRSATGASRPICDYKWVSYAKQVGATGTIVAPKLYMACGISGATQHLEGMRESQFIVAVNSDPKAPIFQIADICIVEDLTEFIPILIEEIKKKKIQDS